MALKMYCTAYRNERGNLEKTYIFKSFGIMLTRERIQGTKTESKSKSISV